MKLIAEDYAVVVIDIQDKLLAKIPERARLVRNTAFLIDTAKLMGVPVLVTEQYPKGLGHTTEELAKRVGTPIEKTYFNCCNADGFNRQLRDTGRRCVVLTGMEAHVCVLQTALDLLDDDFSVYLPVDAIESRTEIDKSTALARLDKAGAVLTTVETIGFGWLVHSGAPEFKAFSKLVQEKEAS